LFPPSHREAYFKVLKIILKALESKTRIHVNFTDRNRIIYEAEKKLKKVCDIIIKTIGGNPP